MNIKKSTMNTAWLAAIAICVLLSIFALFFTSCTKYDDSGDSPSASQSGDRDNSDSESQGESEAPDDELTQTTIPVVNSGETPDGPDTQQPSANPARLTESADAGRAYLDKFAFLGDSTTYGIGYYYNQGYTELCPPSQVWTPSSGTLALFNYSIATVVYPATGEEIPIAEAVAAAKPEYMLLTIGVNGVAVMDEEWFIRDYKALIELIENASPDTKLILNSIYPVATNYGSLDAINNENINAANVWIEKIAEETGHKFLNTHEVLVGDDGWLPQEYSNGDGIHLNGEGFEIVMDYIRTHAYN